MRVKKVNLSPIYQVFCGDQRTVPYPAWLEIRTTRVPAKGAGANYGETIRHLWRTQADRRGLVILEHDIAVPLEAWKQMDGGIAAFPADVIAIPYVLYAASRAGGPPMWANQRRTRDGQMLTFAPPELPPMHCDTFGLGCTFLSARLLDLMPEDLCQWEFPRPDWLLSQLAMERGIPCHCTPTPAVHLHY